MIDHPNGDQLGLFQKIAKNAAYDLAEKYGLSDGQASVSVMHVHSVLDTGQPVGAGRSAPQISAAFAEAWTVLL